MMHAVVNQLRFKDPIDPAIFDNAENDLFPVMREVEGFDSFHVIQTSEDTAILVIVGESPEVLDRIATEVGSPWMRANVVPHLGGPPERQLGAIVVSTQYP